MPPEADPATPLKPPASDPPEPTGATPPAPEPDATDLGDAGKAALTAERKARSDAEKATKAANAELEKLRKSQMTEQEKAVATAREEGKAEATSAVVQRLAAAEIKAALTGVVVDPAAIVEDLNLSRYIGEDGEVDAEKVAALKAKYEGLTGGQAPPAVAAVPGVPKGARTGTGEPKQLGKAELKSMTPAQIVEARKAGQLNDLMSGAST